MIAGTPNDERRGVHRRTPNIMRIIVMRIMVMSISFGNTGAFGAQVVNNDEIKAREIKSTFLIPTQARR